MFIHRALQVTGTGAASCAYTCTDHPPHHIDMAVSPVAKLVVDLQ